MTRLEKMDAFFDSRLEGYEEHMLTAIESAGTFYPFTAQQLPDVSGARILDLGCGTGLELDWYFQYNPAAEVTGIDLAEGMLTALKEKHWGKRLDLIHGDYFTVPFGENVFDGVVSVESLHHFTLEEKIPLYTKLKKSLKPGGYFILTDYFAGSEEEEASCRRTFNQLKEAQGIRDDAFYHYDTPLTVEHEKQALKAAGFSKIQVLGQWGATCTIKAE